MSDTIPPPPNHLTILNERDIAITEEQETNKLKLNYLLEDVDILYKKIQKFHGSCVQIIEDNANLRQDNHNLKQQNLKLERDIFTLRFNGGKEKLDCGCTIDDIKCKHESNEVTSEFGKLTDE
jgi:hypothetical protein